MTFEQAIQQWVRMMTAAKASYCARNYPNSAALNSYTFELQPGKKNIRVVKKRADEQYGSAYCFIEAGTGKIMKPGGWKAPEPKRYERGNIFRPNPLEGCGPHGVEYRTGGGNYEFAPSDLIEAEKVRDAE